MSELDIHKSMGTGRMHPRAVRELADVLVSPLLIMFE